MNTSLMDVLIAYIPNSIIYQIAALSNKPAAAVPKPVRQHKKMPKSVLDNH
jgi:hypothetical protein